MVDARELDLPCHDVERRPRVPAVRAPVVAEMADVRGSVLVRRAAADTPLRVGCVLELAPRVPLVVEPEADALAPRVRERGHLRVVGVQDEHGGGGEVDGGGPPAVGDVLELAVAVELVAEEIPEADGPWPHPRSDLGQRCLVDLEEPELGAACHEQGGGDARDEVGAGVVVGESNAPAQDLGRHRCRRRLAVRRGYERRPLRQPCREPVDRARVDLPQELPGNSRAAAAAREPRQRARRPGGRDLQRERHRDAHGASLATHHPSGGIRPRRPPRTAFGGFPGLARVVPSGPAPGPGPSCGSSLEDLRPPSGAEGDRRP